MKSEAGHPLSRPGPIWGDYPQRPVSSGLDESATRVPVRARAGLDVARLVSWVREQRARGTDLQGGQRREAIESLRRQGLRTGTVAPALAIVATEMRRLQGIECEPSQLACAGWLLDGRLVEMDTGEGKTVSAALAAAVAALSGAPVHVLTANPYLAARDALQMRPVFDALGLNCAVADEAEAPEDRREAYRAAIVYSTARCVTFDYLRDRQLRDHQCADDPGSRMLRGLSVALIDEADSILIDEARMPLILAEARPDPQARARAWRALDLARSLREGEDFRIEDERGGQAVLTASGEAMVERQAQAFGGTWRNRLFRSEMMSQALRALHRLRRDVDYVVEERRVVIVDPVSGRPSHDRQWSRDLHALVSLKESLPVADVNQTLASISYPRLFARYHHLAGLSGTLREARRELKHRYGLSVVRVPRARPLRRVQLPMKLFVDRAAQFGAAADRAARLAAQGRAVLLVSDSVADTDALATACQRIGTRPALLTARQDHDEAEVIAQAGQAGRITLSTQMAGRGTDIAIPDEVRALGGLHIINLQHNRSRRVDRQVAGRAGRRGDPGSVEHWIRLDDSPLSRDRLAPMPRALAWLARGLAQRRIETQAGRMGRLVPARTTLAALVAPLLLRIWQRGCDSDDALGRRRAAQSEHSWASLFQPSSH